MHHSPYFARILATGSYLPQLRVSNADLAEHLARHGVETSDEWIYTRSGIRARHYAQDFETCTYMATQAAQQTLARACVTIDEVDAIIVATSTSDAIFPSTATQVQHSLGAKRAMPCFDLQAACAGFMYALQVAQQFIENGMHQHVLVIGSEVFSRLLDEKDRSTCVLFGDGAGTVLLSRDEHTGIVASSMHAKGDWADSLYCRGHFANGNIIGQPFIHMQGKAVFKIAVDVLEEVAKSVLALANWPREAIDFFIPHQANIRIIEHCAEKLGLPMSKVITTLAEHGNTSAASIPLALDDAVSKGMIQKGHKLLLEGVGAGFVWGGMLLEY